MIKGSTTCLQWRTAELLRRLLDPRAPQQNRSLHDRKEDNSTKQLQKGNRKELSKTRRKKVHREGGPTRRGSKTEEASEEQGELLQNRERQRGGVEMKNKKAVVTL